MRSETEAAVYFCCLEALQNAAKHAPDARVEVRLWEESGGLLFTVSDDGPGFDPEKAQRGHGFVNMADRLGAIGGTVRWDSAAREGFARPGLGPARVAAAGGQAETNACPSRSSHSRRRVSAPRCSLLR